MILSSKIINTFQPSLELMNEGFNSRILEPIKRNIYLTIYGENQNHGYFAKDHLKFMLGIKIPFLLVNGQLMDLWIMILFINTKIFHKKIHTQKVFLRILSYCLNLH